jgi:hypothetical protein
MRICIFKDHISTLGPANSLPGAARCRTPLSADIPTPLINSSSARPLANGIEKSKNGKNVDW